MEKKKYESAYTAGHKLLIIVITQPFVWTFKMIKRLVKKESDMDLIAKVQKKEEKSRRW